MRTTTMLTLRSLVRLSRANMTTMSGVTYLTATTVLPTPFDFPLFLKGYFFVLFTQFTTHFIGEIYDLPSDRLNSYSTPLTGGTRVLVHHPDQLPLARRAALVTFLSSLSLALFVLPSNSRPIALLMLFLAVNYSAPPFKCNHRGLGELDATYITSILLPYFSGTVQGAFSGNFPFYHPSLAMLVIPPAFIKFALFLVLNLADRRADWASAKFTLPVILGDSGTRLVHKLCFALAYLSVIVIMIRRDPAWIAGFFILPTISWARRISQKLHGYRVDAALGPTLLHSTWMSWSVLMSALVTSHVTVPQIFMAAFLGSFTVKNVLKGRRRANNANSQNVGISNPPAWSTVHTISSIRGPDADPRQLSNNMTTDSTAYDKSISAALKRGEDANVDITIVGGGVAGLISAAALTRLGKSVVVLEKRKNANEAEMGADLALWPGAITILKELGVNDKFFEEECFGVDTVHMCNMDFETLSQNGGAAATILKTIDMSAVTKESGERFVLVSRQSLMDVIRSLVPTELVVYGAKVEGIDEKEEEGCAITQFCLSDESGDSSMKSIRSRVVIGADGAHSRIRGHVSPKHGGTDCIRFCNEICYRGVLDLSSDSEKTSSITALFPDDACAHTMRINYGAGLRSSFGYMSGDGKVGYWWVKLPAKEMTDNHGKLEKCEWPEPLRSLHDETEDDRVYVHGIEDSVGLDKWGTGRVVLIGDAAHVVTPNMGQGACLGIEDGFVLAVELSEYWKELDGHIEAFYVYEKCRRGYAEQVAGEARKQLMLGQLKNRWAILLREMLLRLVPTKVLENKLKGNLFSEGERYIARFRKTMNEMSK